MSGSFGKSILFIDTSVLDEILDVPGWSSKHSIARTELAFRAEARRRLVIPITSLIETGNHICHSTGDRRAAASRFSTLVEQLSEGSSPWRTNNTSWDAKLLAEIRRGAGTGLDLTDLLSSKMAGGGDIAIVAEAGRLKESTFEVEIDLWTTDSRLASLWPWGKTESLPDR